MRSKGRVVGFDSGVPLATVGGRGSVVGSSVLMAMVEEEGRGLLVLGAETGNKQQDMDSPDKHVCM